MNLHYNRGRRWEYIAKKELEAADYTVIRAAGSHGPYDLVAIPPDSSLVKCVQIKATKAKVDFKPLRRKAWESELWVRQRGHWLKFTPDHPSGFHCLPGEKSP